MARKSKNSSDVSITKTSQEKLIETIYSELRQDFAELRLKEDTFTCCGSGNAAIDFIVTDRLDGKGGWPFGRIVELYGNESTGKSMLALLALINCIHTMNGVGILIDQENGFTPSFYKLLGGDPEKLIKIVPKHINEVYDLIGAYMKKVREHSPDVPMVIAYDSLAASPTVDEYNDGMGTIDYGKRAKAHYQGCRLITGPIKNSNTLLLVINQLRHTFAQFGPELETVGGQAMRYFASVRCHLKRGKRLYEVPGKGIQEKGTMKEVNMLPKEAQFVGVRGRFVVEKTRFTAPFREVNFDLYFRGGLSPFSGWFDALHNHWFDENGKYSIVNAPVKGSEDKVRAGHYIIKGDEESFTKKDFLQFLKTKRPDLLIGYDPSDGEALPDGDDLIQSDVDADGNPIEDSHPETYEADADKAPTDAESV